MKPVIDHVNGTVVECNTAYEESGIPQKSTGKPRNSTAGQSFFDVDIMDETSEMELPVPEGKQIQKNYVGGHLKNYDPCWCFLISRDIPWEDTAVH